MTVKEAYSKAAAILKSCNIEAPAIDAGVMLCDIINRNMAYIYAHGDEVLDKLLEDKFMKMIARRSKGEPLQYITGHQEFMGLDFLVNQDVLVPRADTEILVESIIDLVKSRNRNIIKISILDMCTGSGCIAISLARFIPEAYVTAVDISENALTIAGLNSKRLGTDNKVEFLHSNLFDGLNQNKVCNKNYETIKPEKFNKIALDIPNNRKFDIIVSNPPYITTSDISILKTEVKEYEPVLALDGGPDGLDFYKRIITEGKDFLNPNGILAFEVGYNQADDVAELMNSYYTNIKIVKDLANIDRVVIGSINKQEYYI